MSVRIHFPCTCERENASQWTVELAGLFVMGIDSESACLMHERSGEMGTDKRKQNEIKKKMRDVNVNRVQNMQPTSTTFENVIIIFWCFDYITKHAFSNRIPTVVQAVRAASGGSIAEARHQVVFSVQHRGHERLNGNRINSCGFNNLFAFCDSS